MVGIMGIGLVIGMGLTQLLEGGSLATKVVWYIYSDYFNQRDAYS